MSGVEEADEPSVDTDVASKAQLRRKNAFVYLTMLMPVSAPLSEKPEAIVLIIVWFLSYQSVNFDFARKV